MNMIPQLEEKRKSLRKKYPLAFSGDELYAVKQNGGIVGAYIKPFEAKLLQKWKRIVSLAATDEYTIGLCYDGTLVHAGYKCKDIRKSESGNLPQCVATWNNVVDIACGKNYLVGLKSDGTVCTSTPKECSVNETEISKWRNIIAISCGRTHAVGLKADGTVVATGDNYDGRCNVSEWKDIVAISAGSCHTLGLRSNGTVVSTRHITDPKYNHGQTDVASWTDICAIAAGEDFSLGLKSDGSLIATSYIVTSDTYLSHLMNETKYTSLASRENSVADIFGFHDNGVFVLRKNGTLAHMGGSDFFRLRMDVADFRNKIAQIKLFVSYEDFLDLQPEAQSYSSVEIDEALRIATENPQVDYPYVQLNTVGTKKAYYDSVVQAMELCQKSLDSLEAKKSILTSTKQRLGLFAGSKKRLIDTRLSSLNANKAKIEQRLLSLQEEYNNRPISLKIEKLPVGGIVKFGSFEQQRRTVSPILWKVLQKYQDMALLVSVNCLDARNYASSNNESWAESSLRKWLNGEFLRQAFTEDELREILSVKIHTPDKPTGNVTVDKVFCLSVEEVQKYMPQSQDRHTRYTECAIDNLLSWVDYMEYSVDGWWLRSPGTKQNYAACVWGDYIGNSYMTNNYHIITNRPSKIYLEAEKMMPLGIRPAIWVKVNG